MANQFTHTLLALATLATLALPGAVLAQSAVIHLKSGQTIAADIVSVDDEIVRWRLDPVSPDIQSFPHGEISHVEFPSVAGWEEAETALEEGRLEDAAELYEKIASVQFSGNYYPAPGNFSTLARRRLFDIYSRLAEPAKIAKYYDKTRIELLPPEERDLSPVLACWSAAGKEEWEELIRIAEKIENIDPFSRAAAELGYLMGLAYAELGEINRALTELGKAYTLNLGTDADLAKTALQQSADLIESLGVKERDAEVQALVHVFANVFGNKSLWPGAPSKFAELQKKPLRSSFEASEDKTGTAAAATEAAAAAASAAAITAVDSGKMAAITPVGGTGLDPAPVKPADPAKPAKGGVIFTVGFDPDAVKGNASDPKYSLFKGDGGAFLFRVKSDKHTYVVTSLQAGSDAVYAANGNYEFSITAMSPSNKAKRAECIIELGYMDKGRFYNVNRRSGYAGKAGKAGYANKNRNKVVATIGPGDAAVGKPIAIRLSGRGDKEVYFFSDGRVEELAK